MGVLLIAIFVMISLALIIVPTALWSREVAAWRLMRDGATDPLEVDYEGLEVFNEYRQSNDGASSSTSSFDISADLHNSDPAAPENDKGRRLSFAFITASALGVATLVSYSCLSFAIYKWWSATDNVAIKVGIPIVALSTLVDYIATAFMTLSFYSTSSSQEESTAWDSHGLSAGRALETLESAATAAQSEIYPVPVGRPASLPQQAIKDDGRSAFFVQPELSNTPRIEISPPTGAIAMPGFAMPELQSAARTRIERSARTDPTLEGQKRNAAPVDAKNYLPLPVNARYTPVLGMGMPIRGRYGLPANTRHLPALVIKEASTAALPPVRAEHYLPNDVAHTAQLAMEETPIQPEAASADAIITPLLEAERTPQAMKVERMVSDVATPSLPQCDVASDTQDHFPPVRKRKMGPGDDTSPSLRAKRRRTETISKMECKRVQRSSTRMGYMCRKRPTRKDAVEPNTGAQSVVARSTRHNSLKHIDAGRLWDLLHCELPTQSGTVRGSASNRPISAFPKNGLEVFEVNQILARPEVQHPNAGFNINQVAHYSAAFSAAQHPNAASVVERPLGVPSSESPDVVMGTPTNSPEPDVRPAACSNTATGQEVDQAFDPMDIDETYDPFGLDDHQDDIDSQAFDELYDLSDREDYLDKIMEDAPTAEESAADGGDDDVDDAMDIDCPNIESPWRSPSQRGTDGGSDFGCGRDSDTEMMDF